MVSVERCLPRRRCSWKEHAEEVSGIAREVVLVLLGWAVAVKSCRDLSTSCDIWIDTNANGLNPLLEMLLSMVLTIE